MCIKPWCANEEVLQVLAYAFESSVRAGRTERVCRGGRRYFRQGDTGGLGLDAERFEPGQRGEAAFLTTSAIR